MVKINIYKLTSSETLISSLLLICNKILANGEKAILNCDSIEKAIEIDEKLWSSSASEFLPHMLASSKEFEEFQEEVPIALQVGYTNIIQAENLIIFSIPENLNELKNYKKVFFIIHEPKDNFPALSHFWSSLNMAKNEFESKYYEQAPKQGWKQLENPAA